MYSSCDYYCHEIRQNGSEQSGIEPGKPANFIVLDAANYYEALNRNDPVLYSYRNGNRIGSK